MNPNATEDEVRNMRKLPWMLSLATVAAGLSAAAAAQEVGKVISSTPITRESTAPRVVCSNDERGRESCRNVNMTDGASGGYMVEYEYKGKRYTTEMSSKPGATIELEVSATPRAGVVEQRTAPRPAPTYVESAPEPRYVEPRYVERVYDEPTYSYEPRERVYVEQPVYVERRYSYPYYSSYYNPWYPVLGVALGYSIGRSWHGHHHHGWRGHSHRGHGRR
jgi:hypothetical protein